MARITNQASAVLLGTVNNDVLDATVVEHSGTHLIDRLHGLGGNDTYLIDFDRFHIGPYGAGSYGYEVDQVVELAGQGTDTARVIIDGHFYRLADNVENLVLVSALAGAAADGNALANVITQEGSADSLQRVDLNGDFGNDTISARGYLRGDFGDGGNYGGIDFGSLFAGEVGGHDTLTGLSLYSANDVGDILIGDADNLLDNARGGNDTINGGNGTDLISGDAGYASIDGSGPMPVYVDAGGFIDYGAIGGNDILRGALATSDPTVVQGGDVIFGDVAGVLAGRGGNDIITGSNGNDDLFGDAGELLYGGFGGHDTIDGGGGSDLIFGDGRHLERALNLATSQFHGAVGGNDTLDGGGGADSLIGDAETIDAFSRGGNDTLRGGDGDDAVYGDTTGLLGGVGGNDRLEGGNGNDWLVGDSLSIAGSGRGGNDTLFGGSGDDILSGDGVDDVDRGGNDALAGDAGDDLLFGDAGADQLNGGDGNDVLYGGFGADAFTGGAGDDRFVIDGEDVAVIVEGLNGGDDTVISTARVHALAVNVENLIFVDLNPGDPGYTGTGNAGDNRLQGANTADQLFGLAGNDTLDGQEGADRLEGGLGNDVYLVDDAGDVVVEAAGAGTGTDTVYTGLFQYTLPSNVENLTVVHPTTGFGAYHGNAANNVMLGGLGSIDTLSGGAGNDTLDPMSALVGEVLIGGTGNDTYVVRHSRQVTVERANQGVDVARLNLLAEGFLAEYILAAEIENVVIESGTSIDTLIANGLNNSITGSVAGEVLIGMGGNDSMAGGGGDDVYFVQDIGDTVTEAANAGHDEIQAFVTPGGAAGYLLPANVERLLLRGPFASNATGNLADNEIEGSEIANRLDGGEGHDRLFGNRGNDTLLGGGGNDVLNGGRGADLMQGGLGNDEYVVDSALDRVSEAAASGTDTIRSEISFNMNVDGPDSDALADGLNVENLILTGFARLGMGNALANVITGNAVDNVLSGLGGDDILDGGTGIDRLLGGLGNDRYRVDNAQDSVVENANEGTDSVEASANYTLPDQVENLTLVQGSTATSATGNGLANNLIGNSLANTLSGGGGNDVLFGLLGMDVLAGDGGNDTLHGGDDSDVLQGGAGNDTLNGGAGGDSAYGGADDDVLNGDAGSDHLYGDAGADRLNGGADHDQLFGGTENDVLNGDAGDDTLNGGQHNDTLDCGTGNDDLFGGSGADVLNGGDGDDSLLGEDDNDTLNGGAGADVLDGGGGADTLAGGLGDDTYIVDNTSDVVTEAAAAGTDTIVSSISFNLSADGPDANAVVDGLNVENLTLTGSATTGTGSSTNNVLTDSGGANTLVGLAGNDTYVYSGTLGVDDVAQDSAGIDNLTASVDTSLTPHIDGIESWYLRALASASLDFSASSGVNRLDLEVADGAVFELAATPILSGGIGLRGRPGGDYGSPSEFGTLDVRAAAAGALTFDLHGAGDSTRGISATLITTNSAQAISETLRLTDPTAFNQLDVSAVDGEVGITGDGHLRLVGLVPGSGGNSLLNTRLYVHNATLDLELAVASAIGDASVVDEALRLELEDASVALAIEPGLERLDLVSSGGAANSLNVGSPFGGVDPWEVLSPGYGTLLDAGLEFVITGIADLNLEHVRVKSVDAREFLGDLVMSIESEFGPFVNDEGTHLRAGNGVYTLFGGTHDDEFEMGGFLDHLDFISDAGVGDGDLLSATFNGFGSSAVAMPLYIHNIETLSIASTGSASAIDANAITGVTTINVQHSAGGDAALELQNVHATTVNAGGFTANLGVVFSDVGNHAAFGGDGHDTLTGGAGDDELSGGLGNDVLFGDQGADELVGGADNDSLNGGDGIDALSGGSGADTFVFDRDPGPTNFDVIEDFVSATDVLQLDDDIFTALAGLGSAPFALAAVNFRAAADGQATSATQFILYNTSSGGVFYDADGNGAGSALQFASLTGAPTLLHSDIFVIA